MHLSIFKYTILIALLVCMPMPLLSQVNYGIALDNAACIQHRLLNEALRMTDSLIANGALTHHHDNTCITTDSNKTVKVSLYDLFEGGMIDNSGLKLKYSTDSLEYDRHYISISIYWDNDEFDTYGSPYVDVHLTYYLSEAYYTVPSYRRHLWSVMFFVKDGIITHYSVREMAE